MDIDKSRKALSEPLLCQDNNSTINDNKSTKSHATESFHGKASPLSSGTLFGTTPRGLVVSLPHPDKPCLLFSDWCPIGECALIALLEKEWQDFAPKKTAFIARRITEMNLFTVVHVCETLAKHGDVGSRLLKKLTHISEDNILFPNSPVLVQNDNIIMESCVNESTGLLGLLLPGYIDEAIGQKNSLKPDNPIGLYNMNLFIRRHSNLPNLVNELIICQSPVKRIKISTDLLNLLKIIDIDLQKIDGPYLCGERFTLADIFILPFMERVVVVLSHYRNFFVPPSLNHLITWYETVLARPSVRIATLDRDEASISTYCYEQTGRKEYLLEVYECQIRGEMKLFKELNEKKGAQAGVNLYREAMEEDNNDRRVCEVKTCQQCVVS